MFKVVDGRVEKILPNSDVQIADGNIRTTFILNITLCRGCSAAVEHCPRDLEVEGSIPPRCIPFFFIIIFLFLAFFHRNKAVHQGPYCQEFISQ